MSLDNVLAIAAAAKGHPWLIGLGLAISIPLIVAGATLIMALLHRFPILVWAGAGLLGWIAGELMVEDPVSRPFFDTLGADYGLNHTADRICDAGRLHAVRAPVRLAPEKVAKPRQQTG